jgi:hypothetical protein
MLYTNYKQIAEITLNSEFAEYREEKQQTLTLSKGGTNIFDQNHDYVRNNEGVRLQHPVGEDIYSNKKFYTKYRFKVNLLNPMSKNLKIAVKSFSIYNSLQSGSDFYSWDMTDRNIGCVYIDNVYDKNSFHSDPNVNNKFHLLSMPLCHGTVQTYFNNDILNSAKSIQNNIFQNNYLDIVVNAKIRDFLDNETFGVPETAHWNLTLILYDTEFEENPKLENYGRMPVMPPKIIDLT